LIWVEKERLQGWACATSAREFKSSGPLVGNTLDEMKRSYERQRDEQLRAHVCAKHPKLPAKS
jgi:hypothetical protein